MDDLSGGGQQWVDDPRSEAQIREFRWRSELQQRTVSKAIRAVAGLFGIGTLIAAAGVWVYYCTGTIEWPVGALVASFMLPGTVICAITVRAVFTSGARKEQTDISESIAPHVSVLKDLLEITGAVKSGS